MPEILRAWSAYLAAVTATDSASASRRSSYWSAAARRATPQYDLVLGRVGRNVRATVLEIRPSRPGGSDEYVVKTLYTLAGGPSVRGHEAQVGLGRVYAVRENGGRWVFENTLSRTTRDWRRDTVGPITYVVQPGVAFDRARAERAVAFSDSLTTAFGLPPIAPLTYYVADTPDEIDRIIGLDWYATAGGGGGGFAVYGNHQVFSGDPSVGEEYRHELVHYALAPLVWHPGPHWIMGEGLATWLGGTLGMTPAETLRAYADYVAAHPAIALDSVFRAQHDVGYRPAGAVLCAMAFERHGLDGVKAVLSTGNDPVALEAALERVLGMPWPEVAVAWRAKVLSYRVRPAPLVSRRRARDARRALRRGADWGLDVPRRNPASPTR